MLTVDNFTTRAKSLWESQKRMAAAKKWKSGKRAGTERSPAATIEFTQHDFGKWLWHQAGLNAIPCPYCKTPIDILSLTVDHITPRSAGGKFTIENMQCICQDCNARKGNFTARAFDAILRFMQAELTAYDKKLLLSRLKAANAGSGRRFFRDKKKGEAVPRPAQPNPLEFFTEPEF